MHHISPCPEWHAWDGDCRAWSDRAPAETPQTGSSWSITAASCLADRHSCIAMTS